MRRESAAFLTAHPFDGFAIGGLAVGDTRAQREEMTAFAADLLPADRPRYLMGVGTPRDLVVAIGAGVDMFDCVLPTRNARNGQALTRGGAISIKQAQYKSDAAPIDEACGCPCCRGGYSRAYLRHLFMAGEILVLRLLTQHNLWLYGELVRKAREAILAREFAAFARAFMEPR